MYERLFLFLITELAPNLFEGFTSYHLANLHVLTCCKESQFYSLPLRQAVPGMY